MGPLLAWQNYAQLGSTLISASSEYPTMPARRLRYQMRSDRWRSAAGWTISAGFNDELLFDEGAVRRLAYLARATYPTGTAAAAAVQAAMASAGIDPSSLSPSLWLRSETLDATDGALTQWADTSANAFHVTPEAGSPTVLHNTLNGRPVVHLDGASHLSRANVPSATLLGAGGTGTVFVVFRLDADTTLTDVLWWFWQLGLRVDAGPNLVSRFYDGSAKFATKAGGALGTWHVGVWHCDGGGTGLAFQDDQDTAAAASVAVGAQTPAATAPVRLGFDGGTGYMKGDLAEVLIFPTALSEEQRRRVTDYLVAKFGLTNDTTSAATWGNTHTATYDSSTKAFTLARATGADAFGLPWTRTEFRASCGRDLGFDVSADDSGAASYVADGAAYQGRHFLSFDLRGALGVRAVIAFDHNSEQGGTYTARAAASAAGALRAPALTAVLDSTGYLETFRAVIFAEASYRYWAIVIDDVGNEDGFVELGVPYLGSYLEIDFLAQDMERSPADYSSVAFADQGSSFQDRRQATRVWTPTFEAQERSVVEAVDAMFASVLTGGNWFFIPEPAVSPLRVLYGFMPGPPDIKPHGGSHWDIGFKFQEALG